MADRTVVEYDATKAMAEIARLERRIQELEGKTKRSFDKMGSASEGLEKGIKGLNAPAGTLVENVRKLTAGITPLGLAIGASAGSVAQLLGEIVELPAALRSTEERVKAFTDGLKEMQNIAKAGIKLEASIEAVNIEEQIKAIQLTRADLQEERVGVTERRDALREKLEAEKAFQTQRKNVVQAANRDIARLEDLAQGIRDKSFLRSLGDKDLNQQLDALLGRAAKLRQAGGQENFQRAERLIDQASSIAGERGDFADVGRVAAEERRLVQAIDETVKARREQHGAEAAVNRASDQRIASLEREIKLLTQEATAIRNRNKLLTAEETRKRLAAGDVREVEGQRIASRERQDALQSALARFTAQRDLGTAAADATRRVLGSPFDLINKGLGGQTTVDQQAQVNLARQLAGGAFGALQKATPEGNQQAVKFLEEMRRVITQLESGQGVAKSLQFDVNNLKEGARFLREAVEADERFVQSRGSTENFSLGAVNQEAERYAAALERAADASGRTAGNISQITGVGLPPVTPNAPSLAPAAPVSVPAAQGAGQGGQTTVNINVKGGIIDPDVSRAIGDEVRRQLRRGTGPGSR